MKPSRISLVLAIVIVGSAETSAQVLPQVPPNIAARDTGAVMHRLADGVYAIIHDGATEDWPHGNTGVIVGPDGVLVIDSNYLPARAVDDIALIRRVTNLPVRYLVNTHWHGDHTHGNGVYRDSFPGLVILGARESAGFIDLNLRKLPAGGLAPDSRLRQTLAAREALLTRGRDSTGRALTDDERRDLAVVIAQRRFELLELAKIKIAPPTHTFDGTFSLDLGRRRVEIRNMGPANSAADVIVYLPEERILFAGDILVYPAPYTSGSFFLPWISVLKSLQSYPVAAVVLGHGPVMANHEYTRNVHELFEAIRSQLDSLLRLGHLPSEAAKRVDVKDLRLKFTVPAGRAVREAFWEEFTRGVAERMGMCVMGYSC